ncbi:MAG: oxidoreductase [Micavibrio sp.]|nr:oxidoreductase [Micavibrio sp.]
MPDTLPLKDKIAFISGASRGIGAATAKALASKGAHAILSARTISGLEKTHDEIVAAGGAATIMPLDFKKEAHLDALGPTIFERFGQLDILIGNAASLGGLRPIGHTSPKVWEDTFKVNVHANYALIRTLDPLLRQSEAGRAVFISSQMAQFAEPFWGLYAATKTALNAMVLTYAAETVSPNLKANLFDPGTVNTKMLEEAYPGGYPDEQDLIDIKVVANKIVDCCLPDFVEHGKIIRAH